MAASHPKSRRQLLKVIGASASLATIGACVPSPDGKYTYDRECNAICVTFASYSRYINIDPKMPKTKIATLNLRIDPGVKEAVREAAEQDHRSIANMVEMLIRRHCDESGITIPEQSDLFPEKSNG